MRFPSKLSFGYSFRAWIKKWSVVLVACSFSLFISSCDTAVKGITVPELSVSPSMLYIGNPPSGVAFSESSLVLTNVSNFNVTVTEIRLEEEDEVKELSIMDAELWESPVIIPPGEGRTISIMWNSQDEFPDLANLTIISNAGEQTVSIETEPPRAQLSITSTPEITELVEQKRINITSVSPGESQSIIVRVKSLGLLPLVISDICLSLSGESCFDTLQNFRLCEGMSATNENCTPILDRGGLNLEEERIFSVLFEPKESELRTSKVELRVISNAYMQQEETIELVGIPCLPSAEDESCRPFHFVEAGTLYLGAQKMTSENGQQLDGQLLPSSHLSYDSKLNLYLKGSVSP